ncbi:hypothetical protein K435DRAFT_877178 [Dendrothele bispora CBS 962.96]|uniref:Uncharacterized protein n=1 Tax=Dendrothele bispora (strain CBS 962.96) TaxID=1314807 RepID=A0A4S8KQJ4_DENBC|nr:hypothetical protein K435DRAFT_877178 [Dendrothele bispora CBS 962.96]
MGCLGERARQPFVSPPLLPPPPPWVTSASEEDGQERVVHAREEEILELLRKTGRNARPPPLIETTSPIYISLAVQISFFFLVTIVRMPEPSVKHPGLPISSPNPTQKHAKTPSTSTPTPLSATAFTPTTPTPHDLHTQSAQAQIFLPSLPSHF